MYGERNFALKISVVNTTAAPDVGL